MLPSALIMSALMVSVSVTYARHAVLAKTRLIFETGARESEEDGRSGLQRVRQNWRLGVDFGEGADADEVITPDGNIVTTESTEISNSKREVRIHTIRENDEEAFLRIRSDVVPESSTSSNVEPTRVEDSVGDAVMLAGNLTIVSGSTSYADTTMSGLFLLEDGAEMTVDDVVLRGTIITRSGINSATSPPSAGNRPKLIIEDGFRLLSGNPEVPGLNGVAMVAPGLEVTASPDASIDIEGAVICRDLDLQCRGSLRGPVVTSGTQSVSGDVVRPLDGRGPQQWPVSVVPGAERATRLAFRADTIPQATLDFWAGYDLEAALEAN